EAPGPVGMMLCRVVADDCEVLTIAVDPQARRRGVAHALVQAALLAAAQAGATAAFLEVAVDNPAAEALYAGLGFRRIATRRGYYSRPGGEEVDAFVMRIDLNAALP
ncbi:MAG: GNAT family N-acetyltransferase, partial [Phenylobacterium sp.]|uniref:GNAT family N-acetyltransferase n=1 Tax=Phenylobacterium sp. TaxID=1871053 RepID=UPI0027351D67